MLKRKKLIKCFLSMCLSALIIINCVGTVTAENDAPWKELYVSVNGDDAGTGSKESPFKTVQRAKDEVRLISSGMKGDIIIHIGAGRYFLEDTLDFTVEDSGKNGYKIIYKGDANNTPVISAGKKIEGFEKSTEYPGLYQIRLDDEEYVRSLYVNDEVRYIAKSTAMVKGVPKPDKLNTDKWYSENPNAPAGDSYNFYDPETIYQYDGLYMSKEDIGFYDNVSDIEFCWNEEWESYYIHVKSIEPNPDNDEQVIVRMDPSVWNSSRIINHINLAPRGERSFIIRNAMELLDEPGEFYFNRSTKILYYMPYADENMNTADVVIPGIDTIARISGNGPNDKVENITFEGIQFSHTSCNIYGEASMRIAQGAYTDTNAGNSIVSGAVVLNYASGINFYRNHFHNTGNGGLELSNGVENSNVTGNVFTDIGAYSVGVGRPMHYDDCVNNLSLPQNVSEMQLNLANVMDSDVATSYYGDGTSGIRQLSGNAERHVSWMMDNYATQYNDWFTWKGDPYAADKGEKTWIRYDFKRKYDISKVVLTFADYHAPAAVRRNFEILLSNDRYFKEGNYEVAAVQKGVANTTAVYNIQTTQKYRYMMIRTLGSAFFAVSGIWIFTEDKTPYIMYERCKNIDISNNYIERSGLYCPNAGGILMYYVEGMNVTHNEIIDIPYSAIQIGWGWSNTAAGSSDNNIQYNYIENCTRLIGDGGGIYNLSLNPGTVISNNYFNRMNNGQSALYLDQGSAETIWRNNAISNTSCAYIALTLDNQPVTITNNNVYDNYSSTGSKIVTPSTGALNSFQNVKTYVEGKPSREAYSIKKEAGLESGYQYLRGLAAKNSSNLMPDYYLGTRRALTDLAQNILNQDYGLQYGRFSFDYHYKLKKAYEDFNDTARTNSTLKKTELNKVVYEAGKNLNRLPIEEMVELCDEKAASGDNSYPQSAMTLFQTAVNLLKAQINSGLTPAEEYDILTALETAYNNLENSRIQSNIDYVWVEDSEKVVIDSNSHVVTVTMPDNTGKTAFDIDIYTHGTASVSGSFNSIGMNDTIEVPIFCSATNQYTYWYITTKKESSALPVVNVTADDWFTKDDYRESVVQLRDGSKLLPASPYPYMSRTCASAEDYTKITIKFVPITPRGINSFSAIIGAENYKTFEYNNNNTSCARYEVRFATGNASLYYVANGGETCLDQINTTVEYNAENELMCQFKEVDGSTNLVITLNGRVLFDRTGQKCRGRYVGLYSPKLNIKVLRPETENQITTKVVDLLANNLKTHSAFPRIEPGAGNYTYQFARDGQWDGPETTCWFTESDWSSINYLQMELKSSFILSEIKFSLRQGIGNNWIRYGTEILASNDSDFSDYDVLWSSPSDPGEDIISVDITGTKFRNNYYKYIRFSKTNINPVGLTEVKIYGFDEVTDLLATHMKSNSAFPYQESGGIDYSYNAARDGVWFNVPLNCWLTGSLHNGTTNYLQVEFDNSYRLTEIKFTLRQGAEFQWSHQGTAIYGSNDPTFGESNMLWYDGNTNLGDGIITANIAETQYSDVRYKYIRIQNQNQDYPVGITELEIFGYDETVDLLSSHLKTDTAYPEIEQGAGYYSYKAARDGQWFIHETSCWLTGSDWSSANYLQIELDNSYKLSKINFTLRQGDGNDWIRRGTILYASDDPLFAQYDVLWDSGSADPGADLITVDLTDCENKYKYIRFTKTDVNPVGLTELEIRGYERDDVNLSGSVNSDLLNDFCEVVVSYPATETGGNYTYEYARDGRWFAPATSCWLTAPDWNNRNYFQIELSTYCTLTEIRFTLRQGADNSWIRQGTEIWASDNALFNNYDVLWSSPNDPGTDLIRVNVADSQYGGNSYKYIRFTKNNINPVGLTEVQICGYDTGALTYYIDGEKVNSIRNGNSLTVKIDWSKIGELSEPYYCVNSKFTAEGILSAIDILPMEEAQSGGNVIELGSVSQGMYVKTFFFNDLIQLKPMRDYYCLK